MTDTLVRAVTTDGNFRAIAIDATEMMRKVATFHEASQLGTTVLGWASRMAGNQWLLSPALLQHSNSAQPCLKQRSPQDQCN